MLSLLVATLSAPLKLQCSLRRRAHSNYSLTCDPGATEWTWSAPQVLSQVSCKACGDELVESVKKILVSIYDSDRIGDLISDELGTREDLEQKNLRNDKAQRWYT